MMRIFWLPCAVCLVASTTGFTSLKTSSRRNPVEAGITNLGATGGADDLDSCDVAIFGGGFGGLYTALAIDREYQRQQQRQGRNSRKKLDIALVTPGDNFVFLPLLYDLTMGTASEMEVCPPYKSILTGTCIRHVKANLNDLDGPDGYSAELTTALPSYKKDYDIPTNNKIRLSYRAAVMAVGATPQSILASIPGAKEYTQPYYTKEHAEATDKILNSLENQQNPRIAVVGGGYGGVELATCVKRRIPQCDVTLLTRGPPMKGTRAEPLINKALKRMNVNVETCSVESVELANTSNDEGDEIREILKNGQKVIVKTKSLEDTDDISENETDDEDTPWDAVLWTAGSGPAYPVVEALDILNKVEKSGRLAIDGSLRCGWKEKRPEGMRQPRVWAIGDCAEIFNDAEYATPKTAQAAIQQADVVANNLLVDLGMIPSGQTKTFQYQDLGSMLTLGGPNGAVLAPPQNSLLGPLFAPAMDIARVGFGIADGVFRELSKSETGKKTELGETVENLGLSLGGYGLGVDPNVAPGTLAGTMSGLARRSIYALRMPTNRQRIIAASSAGISTAIALAKEANALNEDNEDEKK